MSILSVGGQKQRNTAFSLSERRPEHRTLRAFRVFKRVEYPTVRVRFALLFRISFRRVPDSYQPRPADEEKGASVHSSPIRTCRYRAASVRPASRSGDARGLLPIPSRRPPAVRLIDPQETHSRAEVCGSLWTNPDARPYALLSCRNVRFHGRSRAGSGKIAVQALSERQVYALAYVEWSRWGSLTPVADLCIKPERAQAHPRLPDDPEGRAY